MSIDKLFFNWFDLLILIMVMIGIQRGRKRGISEELLTVLKWLTIIVVCSVTYEPLGSELSHYTTVISPLSCYLIAYVGGGLVIATAFAGIKKVAGGKLVGSDAFGRSEYYLGMIGGTLRFLCILIAGLALLNARAYSSAEIKADVKYQNEVYGSNFFPSLYTIQAQVFNESMSGPWIKKTLAPLLIKPTAPTNVQYKQKDYALP